jgi:8-oxo-dGTP diphosphatase
VEPCWFVVNVEAAVVQDGRYLMVIRGPGETHAAGTLALIGGKIENAGTAGNILEDTLRREIREEVGVEVQADMTYVESKAFVADDGDPVVDIVFLCRHQSGTPTIGDPDEVAVVEWMTVQQILDHPKAPSWTRDSIRRVEQERIARGW